MRQGDDASCDYGPLEQRLGHAFAGRGLLRTALTHKSWLNERPAGVSGDNERLEFLGDAVLALVVSDLLMARTPGGSEGDLSKARAAVVSEGSLARAADRIGLGEWLLLGRGEEMAGGRAKPSLLANTLEALLGAVYVDAGFAAARRVAEALLDESLAEADRVSTTDYKSRLQERTQGEMREAPRYAVVAESGPDHDKLWEVAVVIAGRVYARASGRSKKEAEQAAAASALAVLEGGGTPPADRPA